MEPVSNKMIARYQFVDADVLHLLCVRGILGEFRWNGMGGGSHLLNILEKIRDDINI